MVVIAGRDMLHLRSRKDGLVPEHTVHTPDPAHIARMRDFRSQVPLVGYQIDGGALENEAQEGGLVLGRHDGDDLRPHAPNVPQYGDREPYDPEGVRLYCPWLPDLERRDR